jgi:hypothetical protein
MAGASSADRISVARLEHREAPAAQALAERMACVVVVVGQQNAFQISRHDTR